MDKNTLTGLLLMGLVFLGFMWLTPKNENAGGETAGQTADTPAATVAEPLSA